MKRRLTLSLLCLVSLAGCGRGLNTGFVTPAMQSRGMIYILPGIQGPDAHYKRIRLGLIGAGINCAVMIHSWGDRLPGVDLLINQTNVVGDRQWGRRIARSIVEYQQKYPGRPVYIIGQSAGSGIAVFCAEALAEMPRARPIEGIVLLDASLSADYDLARAISMTNQGIVNFYNEKDIALLEIGTAIFGNVDGGHGSSAGRIGFDLKQPKLYQVKILKDMVDDFADPHFADCSRAFAAQYIAPWIIDRAWPPEHLANIRR